LPRTISIEAWLACGLIFQLHLDLANLVHFRLPACTIMNDLLEITKLQNNSD
jgi:hypothetical protein